MQWENEPPLEASQCVFIQSLPRELLWFQGEPLSKTAEMELTGFTRIAEIEDKIGAGLIEEIIQVADGENQLVDTILESRS